MNRHRESEQGDPADVFGAGYLSRWDAHRKDRSRMVTINSISEESRQIICSTNEASVATAKVKENIARAIYLVFLFLVIVTVAALRIIGKVEGSMLFFPFALLVFYGHWMRISTLKKDIRMISLRHSVVDEIKNQYKT